MYYDLKRASLWINVHTIIHIFTIILLSYVDMYKN